MPKGARTIADLELVVRGADLRRRRDAREIRRELVEIRQLLTDLSDPLPVQGVPPSSPSAVTGTALERARFLCRKWFR